MSGLFITATGTGIGKTFLTAALTRQLRAQGHAPLALKPVLSGFDPASPRESDTGDLLEAMDRPLDAANIAAISPWRFRAPLSPDMAAAREDRAIDYGALLTFCREALSTHSGPVLIEGVGGVMVPLGADRLVLDWMADLKLPVLVAAGAYLGTISHTLTALEVLRARRVPVRGLVLNEIEPGPVPLAETAAALARFVPQIPVSLVPHGSSGASIPDLTHLASPEGPVAG